VRHQEPTPEKTDWSLELLMTRQEVLKKLDGILAKAEHDKTFGSLEIELRGGHVSLIRKTETERIERPEGETTQTASHAHKPTR
jgi:hypothetical protein